MSTRQEDVMAETIVALLRADLAREIPEAESAW
jgi:hypothetical protein